MRFTNVASRQRRFMCRIFSACEASCERICRLFVWFQTKVERCEFQKGVCAACIPERAEKCFEVYRLSSLRKPCGKHRQEKLRQCTVACSSRSRVFAVFGAPHLAGHMLRSCKLRSSSELPGAFWCEALSLP